MGVSDIVCWYLMYVLMKWHTSKYLRTENNKFTNIWTKIGSNLKHSNMECAANTKIN